MNVEIKVRDVADETFAHPAKEGYSVMSLYKMATNPKMHDTHYFRKLYVKDGVAWYSLVERPKKRRK